MLAVILEGAEEVTAAGAHQFGVVVTCKVGFTDFEPFALGRCLKQPVTGVAVLVAEAKAVAGPEQHLLSAVGAAGA